MTSMMSRRAHLVALMASAALCAGLRPATAQTVPWSTGTARPTFPVPADATDCHHHIYDARFQAAPGATLRPPDASVADYRLLLRRLGITRHVVVQPSTYGTDNSLLVQSLKEFGPAARGIAMLDALVTPDELRRLDGLGIRGVRFEARLPGGAPVTDMVPVARKIADLGWHIQLVSDGDRIVELADTLKGMPVPVVFDHMGLLPEPAGPDHPGFKVIADLIDKHGAWVKLTGAYLLSKVGAPTYADRSRLARAYVQLAPERLVWGSDWPHPTSPADAKPDDAVLLDLLANWVPDEAVRNRILVANPASLYGF